MLFIIRLWLHKSGYFFNFFDLKSHSSGDILKYAGDAILSLWQSDPADFPATIEKVVSAAINIQCKMDNYMTGKYAYCSTKHVFKTHALVMNLNTAFTLCL